MEALDLSGDADTDDAEVSVIREKCMGYTNCIAAAPNVFDMDDDNIAIVIDTHPRGDDLIATRRAVRLCPVDAILLAESTPHD